MNLKQKQFFLSLFKSIIYILAIIEETDSSD